MPAGSIHLPRHVVRFLEPGEETAPDTGISSAEIHEGHSLELETLHNQIALLEDELQKAREESFNLGFQDGLKAEQEQHKKKLEAYARQFSDLATRLEAEFGEVLSDMEEPLLRMSFEIAEKVLRLAIPDNLKSKGLLTTLQEFLKEVLHAESVVIRVSPENFEWVQSPKVTESMEQSFPGSMKFVSDPLLGSGECIVETAEHVIDGTFKHQLENLERNLQ